jgi:hypothetical protein
MLYTALSSKNLLKLSTALSFLQGTDTVDTEKANIQIFSVVQEAGFI